MNNTTPTILWFRRDLRLSDHAALTAACEVGGPVIPLVLHDEVSKTLGAAPMWRWGLAIETLAGQLETKGSRLILREGRALDVLNKLINETGARQVYWHRSYDPASVARDTEIKAALKELGVQAKSFGGHLMFEPTAIETKTGGFYKVYTPYWKSVKSLDVDAPLPVPGKIPAPNTWPESDALGDWALHRRMDRGAAIVRPYLRLGEQAAQDRLAHFIEEIVGRYDSSRDRPDWDGTSNLSENLALGEISPHQCWHAGRRALEEGKAGAETFLKELVWREFAYHLMVHTPRITQSNWREEWDRFPWRDDRRLKEVTAWEHARTGLRFVDAGLREMYVTGRMHNRARMIVASVLTKHLQVHWRIGMRWFEECLVDWDPASNAMGWQWSAGSGPDATPYFRVFNPVTQLDKFDPERSYTRHWIAEGLSQPSEPALSYFKAIPKSWGLSASDSYPEPIITAEAGRKAALDAYESFKASA